MPRTTINAEKIDKIIQAVRAGNYFDAASAYARVPRRTFYDWMTRGRQHIIDEKDTLERSLVERIDEAAGQAETRHVALIAQAAEKTWQAAAWWLERRFPQKWGQSRYRDPDDAAKSALQELMEKIRAGGFEQ